MATVQDVCRVMDELFPPRLAENWDNVGLLLGKLSGSVEKLMTCLTLTEEVAEEAVRKGVQMVVTHHPILFRGTKRITDQTAEGRTILRLAESGIAVFSPHTSFDSAGQGINQRLAEGFGLREISPLRTNPEFSGLGSGRAGTLPKGVDRSQFLQTVSRVTGAGFLQTALFGTGEVRRVGVACGAAAEFLEDAIRAGCDTFVTGEARFHAILESQSAGINLILTGHFPSERPAIEQLVGVLVEQIPGIECFASIEDRDPVSVFVAS